MRRHLTVTVKAQELIACQREDGSVRLLIDVGQQACGVGNPLAVLRALHFNHLIGAGITKEQTANTFGRFGTIRVALPPRAWPAEQNALNQLVERRFACFVWAVHHVQTRS